MKNTVKLISICSLIFCSFNISIAQEISRAHYVSAREYLKNNNLSEALMELDSATKIAPNFAEAYVLKGQILELKNEDRKAISQYSLAIIHNPSLSEAYLKRAALHFKLKDHRDFLLNDVNEVISLRPNKPDLYKLKAYYYANTLSPKSLKPDFKNAIIAVSTAISINPDEPDYLKIRCDYKFKSGQNLSALLDINSAIEKKTSDDSYYYLRSVIRFTMGDFRSALNDITNAIDIISTTHSYFQFRGNIYYNLNRYDQAYTDYSICINLLFQEIVKSNIPISPNNSLNVQLRQTLLLRGMALVQENKPYDGCDDFKKALQMGETKANNYIRQYCR